MVNDQTKFREDLQWNSYFVENLFDKIYQEVDFAAQQFSEEHDTSISDDEIEKIVEDIMDHGLESLSEDQDDG